MKWKLFSIVIVLSFILVACNTTNEGARDNNTDGNNVQPTRYNDDVNNNRNNVRDNRDGASDKRMNDRRNGNMNNDRGNMDNNRGDQNNRGNNDQRYDVSKEAANKITDDIKEIDHAYVLTTKNNAYVAAKFNADNDGDEGNRKNNDKGDRDNNRTDRNDRADRDNNTDRNRNDGANDRNMKNNDQMDNDDRLTDDVKNDISDIVKSIDDDIDNVYVSTNPDFLDLTSNYANDMNNGHPVRGFFDKMGDMVERLFPQNR